MDIDREIGDVIDERDIEIVRLLWVGNDGVARGRAINAGKIDSVLESGVSFPQILQSLTFDERVAEGGPFDIGDECVLIPDPATFRVLPYAERAAITLCDAVHFDGTSWSADPRTRLDSYLTDLESEDFRPEVAFESEFYLCRETDDGLVPYDDWSDLSGAGMQSAHEVILEVIEALAAQGIDFEKYYPEGGAAQQEIVTPHGPGKATADRHVLYKQTVRGVAMNRGLRATFVPKPFPDEDGSGCHIHLSLWDSEQEENLFAPDDGKGPYGLSETCHAFIGGVLEHASALTALTAPTINSYRRIKESAWTSAYVCWGEGNREALVRVPGSPPDQRSGAARFEFKAADNTANPYIALIGLLAAGMDGVDRDLDPGSPVRNDPATLSSGERERRGIERLPRSLGDSLSALESDDVLAEALGQPLYEAYLSTKRHQWNEFVAGDDPPEHDVDRLVRSF